LGCSGGRIAGEAELKAMDVDAGLPDIDFRITDEADGSSGPPAW
jgi:hypothetical protein